MATYRRRQFSRLEAAAKLAGGNAAPGSPVANYQAFKAGTRKRNSGTRPAAALLQKVGVGVIPFNLSTAADAATSAKLLATLTIWSDNGRTLLGLSDAELGYYALTGVQDVDNFFPAQLTVQVVKPGSAVLTPISGITGVEYRTQAGQTYTFPIGRSLSGADAGDTAIGDVDEEERRRTLTASIKDKTSATLVVKTVSYRPEKFVVGRANPGARPAGAPANPALP